MISDFRYLKCTRFEFGWGTYVPYPRLIESSQHSPDFLASCIRAITYFHREQKDKGDGKEKSYRGLLAFP